MFTSYSECLIIVNLAFIFAVLNKGENGGPNSASVMKLLFIGSPAVLIFNPEKLYNKCDAKFQLKQASNLLFTKFHISAFAPLQLCISNLPLFNFYGFVLFTGCLYAFFIGDLWRQGFLHRDLRVS